MAYFKSFPAAIFFNNVAVGLYNLGGEPKIMD